MIDTPFPYHVYITVKTASRHIYRSDKNGQKDNAQFLFP